MTTFTGELSEQIKRCILQNILQTVLRFDEFKRKSAIKFMHFMLQIHS